MERSFSFHILYTLSPPKAKEGISQDNCQDSLWGWGGWGGVKVGVGRWGMGGGRVPNFSALPTSTDSETRISSLKFESH